MTCGTCNGDRRLYWAVGFDDRNGTILYDSTPCTECHGTGLAEIRSGMVLVYGVVAIAFIAALAIAAWLIATRQHG